jgi:two-component system, sensor histidine kinase RpfC
MDLATLKRVASIALVIAVTPALFVLGESGAVFVGLYIFLALMNGYRFGRGYLVLSQALGVVGFLFVVIKGVWWPEHMTIAVGWLIAMIVIPLYVSLMQRRGSANTAM